MFEYIYVYPSIHPSIHTHPEHEVGNLGEEERGQLQRRRVLFRQQVAFLGQDLIGPGSAVFVGWVVVCCVMCVCVSVCVGR